MTAETQQNIGQALLKIADIAEKLIPLIRTVGEGMTAQEVPKKVTKASKPKELPAPVPEAPAETPTYTLEDVRAVLAEKSRAGHTEEVKALITKYGAERLSAVDPSNYEALMADAEGIADE